MEITRNGVHSLRLWMLITLACFATSNAAESDISCLRSIKQSLKDPLRIFSSWDFNDMDEGFICRFAGVRCWQEKNIVISIQLADMKLRGPFPIGIKNCTSMASLDLSGNYLSGPIPADVGDGLGFIVDLNLSNNNLSGPIPSSIVNWRYINFLRLDNNHLTGQIPSDLAGLDRIKVFNVTNNRLSGPVPIFSNANFSAESYTNNPGLCGGPLNACKDDDDDDDFLSGFTVGFPLFTILSMLFVFFCFPRTKYV